MAGMFSDCLTEMHSPWRRITECHHSLIRDSLADVSRTLYDDAIFSECIGCSPYGAGWHTKLYSLMMTTKIENFADVSSKAENVLCATANAYRVIVSPPNWQTQPSKADLLLQLN
jgi:hypothetical protein